MMFGDKHTNKNSALWLSRNKEQTFSKTRIRTAAPRTKSNVLGSLGTRVQPIPPGTTHALPSSQRLQAACPFHPAYWITHRQVCRAHPIPGRTHIPHTSSYLRAVLVEVPCREYSGY